MAWLRSLSRSFREKVMRREKGEGGIVRRVAAAGQSQMFSEGLKLVLVA